MILSYRWEHTEKKRFYRIILAKDLLNDLVLTKVWGGISNASGKITHTPCPSLDIAKLLIANIAKTRKQRGYELRHEQ
jgi:hypothetical protein